MVSEPCQNSAQKLWAVPRQTKKDRYKEIGNSTN